MQQWMYIYMGAIHKVFVTGPAKMGHVVTNYIPSHYGLYLSAGMGISACIIMSIKHLRSDKKCMATA